MVAYLSADAKEHATMLWCARCGALGLRSYDKQVKDRWQLPDPRLPVRFSMSPDPEDAAERRKKARAPG